MTKLSAHNPRSISTYQVVVPSRTFHNSSTFRTRLQQKAGFVLENELYLESYGIGLVQRQLQPISLVPPYQRDTNIGNPFFPSSSFKVTHTSQSI